MNRKERRNYFRKADKAIARNARWNANLRAEYDQTLEDARTARTEEEQAKARTRAARLLRRLERREKGLKIVVDTRNQRATAPIQEPYRKPVEA